MHTNLCRTRTYLLVFKTKCSGSFLRQLKFLADIENAGRCCLSYQHRISQMGRPLTTSNHGTQKRVYCTATKETEYLTDKYGYETNTSMSKQAKNESGIHHVNMAFLPKHLKTAAEQFYKRYPRKVLEKDGQKLARYIKNRGRPTERTFEKLKEFQSAVRHAVKEVKKTSEFPADYSHEEEELLNKSPLGFPKPVQSSNFSYIRYKEREAAAYMASRLEACYGVTLRVFNEIKKREPDFSPNTMLDFGSGLGTAVWAAHSIWGKGIKEYQCVDISDQMNEVNQFLLRGTENKKEPTRIPAVFFSKFLPFSHRIKYDVVVAAYTLSELPTMKQRKVVIDALWRKTNQFLVIIEPGNNEGFEIALKARDYVTKRKNTSSDAENEYEENEMFSFGFEDDDARNPGHVFSPCPHDSVCARSEVDFRDHPCNFDQKVQLSLSQRNTALKRFGFAYERFSHIVLRKGESEIEKPDRAWPRLLKPVKKKKGHVICELCCQNVVFGIIVDDDKSFHGLTIFVLIEFHLRQTVSGNIEKHVLSKAKDRNLYKGVRHCAKWGDQLPPRATIKRPLQVITPPDFQSSVAASMESESSC